VVVGGGLLLRPFLAGDAGGLRVGECFDQPTTLGETVEDVQHHPCGDPHGAEVVFVGDYDAPAGGYPSDDEFLSFIRSTCVAAFQSYTGLDFEGATDYDMSAFTPTASGWAGGDRRVVCYAVRFDGGQMTGSIRAG